MTSTSTVSQKATPADTGEPQADRMARPLAPAFPMDVLSDPYPFYAEVRARAGLTWSADLGGWVAGRHEDVRTGMADPRLSAERIAELIEPQFPHAPHVAEAAVGFSGRSLFFLDAPRHTEGRRCIGAALRQSNASRLQPAVAAMVHEAVAGIVERGGGDLLSELAAPVALALMGEMVGCPHSERAGLRQAIDAMIGLFSGGGARTAGDDEAILVAARQLDDFICDLVDNRPPGQDEFVLDGAIAYAAAHQQSKGVLLGVAADLVSAGYVPLTNLIANTFACLLERPDQLRLLRDQPDLATAAVQEAGRFEAPNQLTSRIVRQEMSLLGAPVAPGDLVFFLLAAANRDEQVFAQADTFDLLRGPQRAITFGAGVHTCLGAGLSIDVAAGVVEAVMAATQELELAEPVAWQARTLRVRGLSRLMVRCA